MKVGIIARSEDRGLGIQTWEAVRHLAPERVLVIDVENPDGFPMHPGRYPGATFARLLHGSHLAESLVREWLDGLDVVFSVETLYDWRLADWARDAGVATVVQLNPEFFQHDQPRWHEQHPTVWWRPTSWRAEELGPTVRHVPVPVALDRFEQGHTNQAKRRSGPDPSSREPRQLYGEPRQLRALHVVGRAALGDRNGTEIALGTASATRNVEWTFRGQRHQDLRNRNAGPVDDYWQLYEGHDVLVMPRRYGGLCLPAQEAMAAGLAVVMPSCPPNGDWPIVPAQWAYRGTIAVPCGEIPMVATDGAHLAAVLDRLASDEEMLNDARHASIEWAVRNSWQALLPLYRQELERAVGEMARSVAP